MLPARTRVSNNKHLQYQQLTNVTEIGIVGAGMSGLFSGFLLDQAGFSDYEILEANDRLGG